MKDMTKGNIFKILIMFSLPLILSGILQQFYTIVDSVIVGNVVGEDSLAAIGATNGITFLIPNLFMGFTTGVSILVSNYYGGDKKEFIPKITASFVITLTVIFTLVSGVCAVFTDGIAYLLNTPSNIMDLTVSYLRILFLGVPFLTVYNIYSALFRGIGDSRNPFIAIVIAAFTNVVLDLIFVINFHMGVSGAAIATITAQCFSAVYLVIVAVIKYKLLHFKLSFKSVNSNMLRAGFSLGLPVALQSSIVSFGSLLLQNIMNGFGSNVVAGITTAYKVDSLSLLPVINVSSALSTFTAQNVGAKNRERVEKGFKVGAMIILPVSILTALIVVLGGSSFLYMFGVSDEVCYIGKTFLYTCSIFYIFFALHNLFVGFLQGTGSVVITATSNVISLFVRLVLSCIFASVFGFRIIAYSEIISWIVGALIVFVYYKKKIWLKRVEISDVK